MFYTISNIIIPLILLSFFTIMKLNKKQAIPYGKWFCIIILLFFTNLITLITQIKGFFLIMDLILKLAIVLLPATINQRIQIQINHLHLQILIQHVRCMIINYFAIWHWKLTEYAMSKMQKVQRKQFINVFIQRLQESQNTNLINYNVTSKNKNRLDVKDDDRLANALKSSYKHFQNKGVSCDLMPIPVLDSKIKQYARQTEKSLSNKNNQLMGSANKHQKQKYSSKNRSSGDKIMETSLKNNFNNKDKQGSNFNDIYGMPNSKLSNYNNTSSTNSSKYPVYNQSYSQKNFNNSNSNFQIKVSSKSNSPDKIYNYYQPTTGSFKIKKPAINLLDQLHQEDHYPKNKFAQQIQEMTASRQLRQNANFSKKSLTPQHIHEKPINQTNYRRVMYQNPYQKQQNKREKIQEFQQRKDDTAQRILQNLDVSASQYSQMFDNIEEFDQATKQLLCTVEAIVQIGHKITAQLQIYNIELYSNSDVRIVSLYGREFQKRKLRYITALPSNYYYLHFSHKGKDQNQIDKRKVKFRGPAKPFMNYLKQDLIQ